MDESDRGDPRLKAMQNWLAQVAPGASAPQPASSDASFRRYFRIERHGTSCIVMDAPPAHENCAPFVAMASWLEAAQLPAPRVLAEDQGQGFLLLDDLGPDTLLEVLRAATTARRADWYATAVQLLVALQSADLRQPAVVPTYTAELLLREMDLFRDWYLLRLCQTPWSSADDSAWAALKAALVERVGAQPTGLVHRDYHSRNLMCLPDGQLGMLDFQDAVRGSLCYDLVSLLRDCYWDLGEQEYQRLRALYLQSAQASGVLPRTLTAEQLLAWCDAVAVQRHLKASGIFARLWLRDGKPGYLGDIPRTLGYISAVCARSADPVWHWLGARLPEWRQPPLSETA